MTSATEIVGSAAQVGEQTSIGAFTPGTVDPPPSRRKFGVGDTTGRSWAGSTFVSVPVPLTVHDIGRSVLSPTVSVPNPTIVPVLLIDTARDSASALTGSKDGNGVMVYADGRD